MRDFSPSTPVLERMAIFIAVGFGLVLVVAAVLTFNPLPFADELDWIPLALAHDWTGIVWGLHNEHRPGLARLVTVFEIDVLKGQLWPAFVVEFACLAGIIAIFVVNARRWSPPGVFIPIAALCVLALVRAEGLGNINRSLNLHYLAIVMIAVGTYQILASEWARKNIALALLAVLVLVAVAPVTYGNGILIWMLAVIVMMQTRAFPMWLAFPVAGVGLALTMAYLAPLMTMLRATHESSWSVLSLLDFLSNYFDKAWSIRGVRLGAIWAPLITGVALLRALWRIARGEVRWISAEGFGTYLLLFASGTAVMTALGRAEYGADQGRIGRYMIIAELAQLGLFFIAMDAWPRFRAGLTMRRVSIAVLIFAALLIPEEYAVIRKNIRSHAELTALFADLNATPPVTTHMDRFYPDPVAAQRFLGIIRSHGLYGFAPLPAAPAQAPSSG